jgi:hypothetical protein
LDVFSLDKVTASQMIIAKQISTIIDKIKIAILRVEVFYLGSTPGLSKEVLYKLEAEISVIYLA